MRPKLAHKVDRTFVHCRRAISQLLWDSELAEVVECVLGHCHLHQDIKNRVELMRTSNYIVARLQGGRACLSCALAASPPATARG